MCCRSRIGVAGDLCPQPRVSSLFLFVSLSLLLLRLAEMGWKYRENSVPSRRLKHAGGDNTETHCSRTSDVSGKGSSIVLLLRGERVRMTSRAARRDVLGEAMVFFSDLSRSRGNL